MDEQQETFMPIEIEMKSQINIFSDAGKEEAGTMMKKKTAARRRW